jgi:hypothetical protein
MRIIGCFLAVGVFLEEVSYLVSAIAVSSQIANASDGGSPNQDRYEAPRFFPRKPGDQHGDSFSVAFIEQKTWFELHRGCSVNFSRCRGCCSRS